jgi:ATP-dependent DNA ligase
MRATEMQSRFEGGGVSSGWRKTAQVTKNDLPILVHGSHKSKKRTVTAANGAEERQVLVYVLTSLTVYPTIRFTDNLQQLERAFSRPASRTSSKSTTAFHTAPPRYVVEKPRALCLEVGIAGFRLLPRTRCAELYCSLCRLGSVL